MVDLMTFSWSDADSNIVFIVMALNADAIQTPTQKTITIIFVGTGCLPSRLLEYTNQVLIKIIEWDECNLCP